MAVHPDWPKKAKMGERTRDSQSEVQSNIILNNSLTDNSTYIDFDRKSNYGTDLIKTM